MQHPYPAHPAETTDIFRSILFDESVLIICLVCWCEKTLVLWTGALFCTMQFNDITSV